MTIQSRTLMVRQEGDECQTVRIILDGEVIFSYGGRVTILQAILSHPEHPNNGYIVYSPRTGRRVEENEMGLSYSRGMETIVI
jgi:hypothetical protein